jgi:dTDP-4-dehydrorhamnose reductase
MPKILLLGKNGQLGWEARRVFSTLGDLVCLDYPDIDFTRPEQTKKIILEIRPTLIVNAVAYTAVDQAENDSEKAYLINATTPGVIAEEARKFHCAFIHFSTDFVFDGTKGSAYVETDSPNPLNMYGKTKLEGEKAVCAADGAAIILRTSWLYSTIRPSFVTKTLKWARTQKELRVVTDQIGNPTWARSLAEITGQLIAKADRELYSWITEKAGVYHLGGDGWTSRYEWTKEIIRDDPHPEEQITEEVLPALSEEFPTPAQRPLNSSMDCTKFKTAFGLSLPPWQAALKLAMESG